jgi:hypothetical protein
MPRSITVDVADWESIHISRSPDDAHPGYLIEITYVLGGTGVMERRQWRIYSDSLSAARQTALLNLDTDVLTRLKAREGV